MPTTASIFPFFRPSIICFLSLLVLNRLSNETFIGYGANRSEIVLQCCCDRTVVGAKKAICLPEVMALNIALIATSV